MKRKFGTVMDEELLRRAKVVAAADGIALSKLLEDALQEYLDRRSLPTMESVVASTWGAMQADAALVQAIMEEEGVLET